METISSIREEWTVGELIRRLQELSPITPVCHDYNQVFYFEIIMNDQKNIVVNFMQ